MFKKIFKKSLREYKITKPNALWTCLEKRDKWFRPPINWVYLIYCNIYVSNVNTTNWRQNNEKKCDVNSGLTKSFLKSYFRYYIVIANSVWKSLYNQTCLHFGVNLYKRWNNEEHFYVKFVMWTILCLSFFL